MALRVPESKFRDHFSIQTSPQNPQKATSGTQIGPQKVIFGHFAFLGYFGAIFQATRAIFSNAIPLIKINFFWVKLFPPAFLCIDPVGSEVFCRLEHFSFWGSALVGGSIESYVFPFCLHLICHEKCVELTISSDFVDASTCTNRRCQ